jgi:hypothetical protein
MKRKTLFILLLVFLTSGLIAQEETTTTSTTTTTPVTKKPNLWFGPRFGLDVVSTTSSLKGVTDQLKGNYQAGIMVQWGRIIYLQPEVYYSSYKITSTSSMNFIKAPIMLGLKFLDLGLFSTHIMGGPMYSMLLDNKDNLTGANSLNWQVGAGIDILGFITADLRYTLNNKSIADQVTQLTTTPSTLNLTVGLKIR